MLYTSRLKSLPGLTPKKQTSEVEKFTDSEAEELFHTYLDDAFGKEEVDRSRQPLLDFAARVEMLPIAVAVGASLLRGREASGLGKAVFKLRLDQLDDGAKDVNALFRTAIESQPPREHKLLNACAVCVQEGFWLPLAAQVAGLREDEADDAADILVRGSLLRVLDRHRLQLHALLREQLRARAATDGLSELQERHASALEKLFTDWETRWQDCRECLEEILPAAHFLWNQKETSRQAWMTYWGYATADRIGEMDTALRILQQEESFWRGRDDRDAKDALQRSYGNQALILQAWGRLEEALALHKKKEAICLELGNKDSLQTSYGNQALILQALGAAGGGPGPAQKRRSHLPGGGQTGRVASQLRQPGADPASLGAAGGGPGTAQETGSHLPGAGQQRWTKSQLRQPGADPHTTGTLGGGSTATQKERGHLH